jgi:hypothetical protein
VLAHKLCTTLEVHHAVEIVEQAIDPGNMQRKWPCPLLSTARECTQNSNRVINKVSEFNGVRIPRIGVTHTVEPRFCVYINFDVL